MTAFDDGLNVYFVTEDDQSNYVTEDGLDYYIFEALPFAGGAKTYFDKNYNLSPVYLDRSTDIESYQYDRRNRQLNIKFRTGREYNYRGVADYRAEGIKDAPSAGKYFHGNVKGKYITTRLDER